MDGVAKVIGGERVAIEDSHAHGAESDFVGALLGEVEDDGAFAVVNILVGVTGSAPVAPAVGFIAAERAADEGGSVRRSWCGGGCRRDSRPGNRRLRGRQLD